MDLNDANAVKLKELQLDYTKVKMESKAQEIITSVGSQMVDCLKVKMKPIHI